MPRIRTVPRRQFILEALARELEASPGERITTASLARACGVSEAALYRHFASKAKMFEGLILFAEENIFARVNQILKEEHLAHRRCGQVLYLLLGFSARNPGITRVLLGDALIGERERLLSRVEQFFARIETQLRQIMREAGLREHRSGGVSVEAAANLMRVLIEGRMHQFVRTRFKVSPLDNWDAQWALIETGLFTDAVKLKPESPV